MRASIYLFTEASHWWEPMVTSHSLELSAACHSLELLEQVPPLQARFLWAKGRKRQWLHCQLVRFLSLQAGSAKDFE